MAKKGYTLPHKQKVKVKYLSRVPFSRADHLGDQIFSLPLGARPWHYAAELPTLPVTYPLCGLALTNTRDILSEMWPQNLTDVCLFFFTINHTQSYKRYLFPQWLSQIVVIRAQTCYPLMGELAL